MASQLKKMIPTCLPILNEMKLTGKIVAMAKLYEKKKKKFNIWRTAVIGDVT